MVSKMNDITLITREKATIIFAVLSHLFSDHRQHSSAKAHMQSQRRSPNWTRQADIRIDWSRSWTTYLLRLYIETCRWIESQLKSRPNAKVMSSKSQVNFDVMQQTHIKNRKNNRVVYWLVQLNPSPVYPQLHLQPWVAGRHTAFSLHPPLSTLHKYCQKSAVYTQHNVVRIYWRSGAATWRYHHNCFGTVIISDKGGCTCFCPCSFVCLSVYLSVCLSVC